MVIIKLSYTILPILVDNLLYLLNDLGYYTQGFAKHLTILLDEMFTFTHIK